MAETAVSLAREHLLPKIWEAVKMLKDLPKVEDIRDELESFQDFINDADQVAEAEKDNNKHDRIKKRMMQLRKAAFCMEDVIDEYTIFCEEKQPADPRCAALLCEAVDFIKTWILCLQMVYKIRDVRSLVRAERESFQSQFPLEQTPRSSRGNQNVPWHQLRMEPFFIKKDEIVGLKVPKGLLKTWLIEGREKRTVISVVGIPGAGKTTLAKQVFDEVHNDFKCHASITVSQSYTVEGLLINMLDKLCTEKKEALPHNVSTMERGPLIEEVRKHLCNKRYVILFDDVWNEEFWDEIESALIDNENKSRILITTRYENVARFCNKSSFIEVHKLEKPLSEEESMKLFCKKAFQYSSDGRCPEDLKEVSLEIVRKCKCLPLAIVAVGGLLSQKDKSASAWGLFSQNLSLELERDSKLNNIAKILSLSYDDLPFNLRPCLLYFGMYPEDYEVKSSRLIRQWMAEGFVKPETGTILEEVAQQYLIELVRRSLVQVSSFSIDGNIKGCRVHDLLHVMILRKIKDTGFCQYIGGPDGSVSSVIFRRLAIVKGSNTSIESIESSHTRAILTITNERLSERQVRKILTKHMLLRVLDFENAKISHLPENLGNLIYLKYLSLRNTGIRFLPKSIGKLQNLETLDVRQTHLRHACVLEMQEEISKLRKLYHLLADKISWTQVGGMTSLQTFRLLRIDDDGVVTTKLEKLKQLRDLRITNFRGEHGKTLCSSINKMRLLEKLHIYTEDDDEVIDLHGMLPDSTLKELCLRGRLKRFANWIPGLQNLVKLSLIFSMLTDDPLKSLKDMPNLMFLCISYNVYRGESLHFQRGGFQKLKKLQLESLYSLTSIIFGIGALSSLEMLELTRLFNLKRVPSGIHRLKKLEVVNLWAMPTNIRDSIYAYGEQKRWIIHSHFTPPPTSQADAEFFKSLAEWSKSKS